MKQFFFIISLFVSIVSIGQTDEYYRTVDWKFYPDSIVQLTDSTYQLIALPFDYNDPGAINRTVGNYVVDYVGHRFQVIDSTDTKLTVYDSYSTGQAPQTGQIARCYNSVGNKEADYIGSVDYFPLDETAKWKLNGADNELLWRNKEPANANIQQHITNDGDLSATNEIQNLTLDSTSTKYQIGISSGNSVSFLKGSSGAYLPLAGGTMTGNILMTSNKLIGGSTTTSDLYLQTTSGVGVTGADMHFLVGNNGATEPLIIKNDGKIGIGTLIPAYQNEFKKSVPTNYLVNIENTAADGYGLRINAAETYPALWIANPNAFATTVLYSDGNILTNLPTKTTETNMVYVDDSGYLKVGAAPSGSGSLTVKEEDGTPSVAGATEIRVSNGTLTDNGGGSVSIAIGTGSSKWTDDGTYIYPNTLEEIYMPYNKAISWRNSTANVSGTNVFKIVSGASKLDFLAGSSNVNAMSIYNNNTAKFSSFNVNGSITADYGNSATYETDGYLPLVVNANGYMKAALTGGGSLALLENDTHVTPSTGYGTYYVKTDGKPYFKNDAGTEYDLTASGSSYSPPVTTKGDLFTYSTTPTRLAVGATNGMVLTVDNTTTTGLKWATPTTGGTVTNFSAGDLSPLFTTTETNTTTTPALSFTLSTATANTVFGNHTGSTAAPTFGKLPIASISATGTPSATTYLRGDGSWATITGGGMIYPSSGIPVSDGSAWLTSITGTANQVLRRNSTNTAYEFFTPNYMNGSGTVSIGTFPFYTNTTGKDLGESYLTVNTSTGAITNTITTTGVYSANIINTNNSGGGGLFVRGGVGSVSNALQIHDYNNTSRFTVRGDGALFAPNITKGVTDTVLYWDATVGEIKRGLKPSGGSSQWQQLTGAIAPATITDEVRIGSSVDMGTQMLQVTGGAKITGITQIGEYITLYVANGAATFGSVNSDYFKFNTESIVTTSATSGGVISVGTNNKVYFSSDANDGNKTYDLTGITQNVSALTPSSNITSHDASIASIGTISFNTTTAQTIKINNLASGMQGTLYVTVGASSPAITVGAYSDAGTTALTTVVIGSALANAANKSTTITYTMAGTTVYLVYGQQQ